jgi:hypothetical protein
MRRAPRRLEARREMAGNRPANAALVPMARPYHRNDFVRPNRLT